MKPVRVRFAPSPTGHLHIGGARTALYNFLFAKNQKGVFILRIEDTDRERSTEEATQGILASLKWLGMEPDEGPYFQSQSMDQHRSAVQTLLQNQKAYRCYCSPEEINQMREAAQKAGQKPRYDGRCRNLMKPPPGKESEKSVIRFKTPLSGSVKFEDLVRGKIEFHCAELDDLILLRSDGSPTYNLSVVVDDIEMNISHVIRGDDHINNTPRQILIYQALEKNPPQFAHLSMILGPDKKKLSKRHHVPSTLIYRDMGFLPEALINYLVRLGWSHGDQEVFSMTELIDLFSFQQVGSSSAALNNEKLLWLNGHYLRHKNAKDLIAPLKNLLLKEGIQDFPETQKLTRMIERTRERCKTLVEMTELMRPYLVKEISYEEQAVKKFLTPEAKPLLEALVRELEKCANWDMMELKSLLNEIAEKNQVKFVKLAQPVRVSLTGSAVSPGIFDVLDLLGKEESLKRLKEGLNQICSS